MDWTALRVSLWLGAGTIAILLPFGIWFGRLLAVRDFRGKLLVEALVTVPLVLPPTVLGFYLLVTFGARSPLGAGVPGPRRPVAAVLVRGAAARLRDREHSVRRPADSARLRSDSRRTCAMPPRAAA